MGAIFVDTDQAAAILGISPRRFGVRYITSGLLKPMKLRALKTTSGGPHKKHMFLRRDIEALKK